MELRQLSLPSYSMEPLSPTAVLVTVESINFIHEEGSLDGAHILDVEGIIPRNYEVYDGLSHRMTGDTHHQIVMSYFQSCAIEAAGV